MISEVERRSFILANTRLQRPPHAPEIKLWLADEITPLWRMTEETLGEMGLPPPFWAFAWAGGQALARYVIDHPNVVANKRVIDFAAGSGIGAIAAMKSGASSVLAIDIDPYAAAAIGLNAETNAVVVSTVVADLLLGDPPEADVILAGDISYEKPVADKVRSWLSAANERGVNILLGDPGRSYFATERLTRLAEYQVETTREIEDYAIKRTGVWTFS